MPRQYITHNFRILQVNSHTVLGLTRHTILVGAIADELDATARRRARRELLWSWCARGSRQNLPSGAQISITLIAQRQLCHAYNWLCLLASGSVQSRLRAGPFRVWARAAPARCRWMGAPVTGPPRGSQFTSQLLGSVQQVRNRQPPTTDL